MADCVTASKTDKTAKEDLIEAERANFMADCVTASKTDKTAKVKGLSFDIRRKQSAGKRNNSYNINTS